MALFHESLGFPPGLRMPAPGLRLQYGPHARAAAGKDGRARFLPFELPFGARVVEAETECEVVVKWVVRMAMPYDPDYDLILVIQPNGFVRTVWQNRWDDTHQTLDAGRYTAPDLHSNQTED